MHLSGDGRILIELRAKKECSLSNGYEKEIQP